MSGANQCLANALRGPVILITIGTLFLLQQFTPFGFGETWPVILIVLGALALAGGRRHYRGQGSFQEPYAPGPGMPPPGPGAPPPPPPPGVRR